MKLNYYTYTIKFTKSGKTRKICIKDIVDIFCKYQTNKSILLKKHKITERDLYLVRSGKKDSVYYFMTPTDLHEYRSLDLSSGKVTDLKKLIGSDSLEKVSYIHIDDSQPVIGVANSRGGATNEDLAFYLNKILNGLSSVELYELTLIPLKAGINRSDVKKLKMISQARVVLDSSSGETSQLSKFFTNRKANSNLEIEISFKRTNAQANSIEKDIQPLLDIIEKDTSNQQFVAAYFRGKQNSLVENVKEMHLDKSLVLYDMIIPKAKVSIEEQIEVKRYVNPQVDVLTDLYFNSMKKKIKNTIPCQNWKKLKDSKSY